MVGSKALLARATQDESPRKKVLLLAEPLPSRAVGAVPDPRLAALSAVRFTPLRLSIIVELNGPSIFPSVPTKLTFPVPALIPPPTSSDAAPVLEAVSVVKLPAAAEEPPMTLPFTVPPEIVRSSATYAFATAVPCQVPVATVPKIVIADALPTSSVAGSPDASPMRISPSPRTAVAVIASVPLPSNTPPSVSVPAPVPPRATPSVPDEILLAFKPVRLAPLRSSMIVLLNGPLIFPSVPTNATSPVPALIPPPTFNALASVLVIVNGCAIAMAPPSAMDVNASSIRV